MLWKVRLKWFAGPHLTTLIVLLQNKECRYFSTETTFLCLESCYSFFSKTHQHGFLAHNLCEKVADCHSRARYGKKAILLDGWTQNTLGLSSGKKYVTGGGVFYDSTLIRTDGAFVAKASESSWALQTFSRHLASHVVLSSNCCTITTTTTWFGEAGE